MLFLSHSRASYELDELEFLPTITLIPDKGATSTTSLTCDCHNCEGQLAVCYCVDCGDKICGTHKQVSDR